jgi:hypothetical protein
MPEIPRIGVHGVFAKMLLKQYGLTQKDHMAKVVELLDEIYNSMSFAHQHILQSLMGYVPSSKTVMLERYLEQHKTKEPKHKKEARERREREQRDRESQFRGGHRREPFYG